MGKDVSNNSLVAGLKWKQGTCLDSTVFVQYQAVKLSGPNIWVPCLTTDTDEDVGGIVLVDRSPGDPRSVPICLLSSDVPFPVLTDGTAVITAGSLTVGKLTLSTTSAGRWEPVAAGSGCLRAVTTAAATADGVVMASSACCGGGGGGSVLTDTSLIGDGQLGDELGINLEHANTWIASQNVAAVALTDAANIATNAALGNVFTVTLGGNRTLDNPTNPVAGGIYTWVITQDGTGSRTLAYGAAFKWPAGIAPTLSVAIGAVDMISAVYTGTTYKAVAQLAFS